MYIIICRSRKQRCFVATAAITADHPSTSPPGARAINPWLIALTVTLATFMEVLDTSIANVALPHIAGNLRRQRR